MACHSDVTKAQCAERRLARVKAKKRLKAVMSGLKDAHKVEQTDTNMKVYSKRSSLPISFPAGKIVLLEF